MSYLNKEYCITGTEYLFLKPVLEIIIEVACKFNFEFLVIGATARDFLIKYVFESDINIRATRDLDFAILIDDWGTYDLIIDNLISEYGFVKGIEKQRLYYKSLPVDIIPFGNIAEGESIFWPPDRTIEMTVTGFKEVLERSVLIKFDDLKFRIVSLEGLIITKLIAWYDRKTRRKTDGEDIGTIFYHYHDFFPDELFDEYLELIEDANYDYILMGVRILSIRLKRFLSEYPALSEQVISIIQEELKDEENSDLALALSITESYDTNLKALKIMEEELLIT